MISSGFKGSDNKAIVRSLWDLPIIQNWYDTVQAPLSYFGLPGPEIADIREWNDFLGHCSGVERLRSDPEERNIDLAIHNRILNNVFKHNLSGIFTLVRGSIEDIIIDGVSIDNTPLPKSSGNNKSDIRFCYSLVNLDFFGGIAYKQRDGAKRIQALRQLFVRQMGTDFLFLMTVNVRDNIRDEMEAYLRQISENSSDPLINTALQWYADCGKGEKSLMLKAAVPLFVKEIAEHNGFTCFCYPPLMYTGSGDAKMVHFAFEMRFTREIFRSFSKQKVDDVLRLPLLQVSNGQIIVLREERDTFDFDRVRSIVKELPENIRSVIQFLQTATDPHIRKNSRNSRLANI